jgi:hypothetical protein
MLDTISDCIILNITYPNYSEERDCTHFRRREDGILVPTEEPNGWSFALTSYDGEAFPEYSGEKNDTCLRGTAVRNCR